MYKTIILPLAKEDIKNIAHWYNTQQEGLGKRFTTEVRNQITFIKKNPKAIQVRYNQTRSVITNRFPYMIHFIIDEPKKSIVITAVFGTSETIAKWK